MNATTEERGSLRARGRRLLWLTGLWSVLAFTQVPAPAPDPLAEARRLEAAKQPVEAFLLTLTVPGAEHLAVRLARPNPEPFLPALRERAADLPPARTKLLEGDLLLALGRRDDALACYRAAVVHATTARAAKTGPLEFYVVEPPARHDNGAFDAGRLALPFTCGPGSHRDNWLLRRFIALEAWPDAATEFARLWTFHQARSRPYTVSRPEAAAAQGNLALFQVTPSGFSGLGLEFALDYAFFLKKQGTLDRALALLSEPLAVMDMDRNPDLALEQFTPVPADGQAAIAPELPGPFAPNGPYTPWDSRPGTSRKEYIRLVYGEFKTAGREGTLIRTLEGQISAGHNAARRVLARVRMHQGQTDAALVLELAYVQAGGFDLLSTALRRGLAFEDARKLAEAAAEYERALTLPFLPRLALPDADEEQLQARGMAQIAQPSLAPWSMPGTPAGQAQFQADLIARLRRLYGALNLPDKALALALQLYEVNPLLLDDAAAVEQTAAQFKAVGREADFVAWARPQAPALASPLARATLLWRAGDGGGAAKGRAETNRDGGSGVDYRWKERFREAGKERLRLLLQAMLDANPKDAQTRLELLDLDGRVDSPAAIPDLEALLESEALPAFQHGKGDSNRTQFRDYHSLAYHLLRLYEKQGQTDKLLALGLRVATGAKPFCDLRKLNDSPQFEYRNENALPEDVNNILAVTLQHADEPTLAALDQAFAGLPDLPAARQLARRRAGGWAATGARPIGWANLPAGVEAALAGNENVLSLALGREHIFAGMPWGVAVYTPDGTPVTRIALAEAALCLATQDDVLWVGTPVGLLRVTVGPWDVASLALDQDLPPRERTPDMKAVNNGVWTLARDGGMLWMGTRRNIQRLDPASGTLWVYGPEDLDTGGQRADWTRFIIEPERVWAEGQAGVRRYDRASDTWQAVVHGEQPVHLVALADGRLWGHVWLNDKLRDRPCLIDRQTLAVTPVLFDPSVQGESCINGPFGYFGTWQGRPVLGPGGPGFYYDDQSGTLRRLAEAFDSDLPEGLRSGFPWRRPDGVVEDYDDTTHRHRTAGVRFAAGRWTLARLPDGGAVLAGRRDRCPRYEYPGEDQPEPYETWDDEGGLYLLSPQNQARRASAAITPDSLPGDMVAALVAAADGQTWVCTNRGVAVLDREDRVLTWLTRADGLCANRVVGGVLVDGRMYLATGWDDHGGGLAVYDPRTAVLSALTAADGLATNNLAGVEAHDGRLAVTYAVEYMRSGDGKYRLHPPGEFSPATGVVRGGGEPLYLEQRDAQALMAKEQDHRRPMPGLGGFVLGEARHGDRTLLFGTRGLLVLRPGAAAPALAVQELPVELRLGAGSADKADLEQTVAAAAKAVATLDPPRPETLAQALAHPNPYFRAEVLASLLNRLPDLPALVPTLITQLADPNLRVRSTALYLLTRVDGDGGIVAALQKLLADPDRTIRAVATIDLCRRGQVPDMAPLRDAFAAADRPGNFAFGATSSIGVPADREVLYAALAPHATAALFALFLEVPLATDDDEPRQKILADLGHALLRHPDAAGILLRAYDLESEAANQVRFAQAVFKAAGPALLPVLHEALASPDRVLRSNAARACGAIADPASGPLLLKALDLESGLSRASIVWALGELKYRDALPRLAELYADAVTDESRRRGSGFLVAQNGAATQAQYQTLSQVDALAEDWDELKQALLPSPVEPRQNDELLEPRHILEAIRQIGAASAQPFYRSLAGGKDDGSRAEAAAGLAAATGAERAASVPVLRNLLADPNDAVRLRAAVSLLRLDEEPGPAAVCEWLTSGDRWKRQRAVNEMRLAGAKAKPRSVRAAIAAIAADAQEPEGTRQAAAALLE